MGKLMESFTPVERRNLQLYIGGIMLYKFGIETYVGAIALMAQERFNQDSSMSMLGILMALNQFMQCVGSVLVGPLMKQFPIQSILSGSICSFALLAMISVGLELMTGARLPLGESAFQPGKLKTKVLLFRKLAN
jgi:MFS-type transporter involved in bile tolerance (Atg22 family)